MLVASSSVGVVDGVHCDSADLEVGLGPGLESVVLLSRLGHGLVRPSAACDDSDRGAAVRHELLERSRRHLHDDDVSPADDCRGGSCGLDVPASVSRGSLDVVDGGSLGDLCERGDVSCLDGASVEDDGLTDLLSLDGELVVDISVDVDDGERTGPSGCVDEVGDDSLRRCLGGKPDIVDVPVAGRAVL